MSFILAGLIALFSGISFWIAAGRIAEDNRKRFERWPWMNFGRPDSDADWESERKFNKFFGALGIILGVCFLMHGLWKLFEGGGG